MYKHYRLLLIAVVASSLIGIITSCDTSEQVTPAPKKQIEKHELTTDEKKLVENYQKGARILAQMFKEDKTLMRTMRDGFQVTRPGQQNVSFKEMLDVSSSVTAIAKGAITFRNRFQELEHEYYGFVASRGTTTQSALDILVADGSQIYFPYEEGFASMASIDNPTVAFDPVDNGDESIGFYYDSNGQLQETMVDDDYAYKNPTFIVMQDDDPLGGSFPVLTAAPTTANGTTALGDTINEIYVGYVTLDDHMDGIFDGNNEVRFVRADGFIRIDDDGKIQTTSKGFFTVNADISRWNANHKTNVWVGNLYDTDWDRTEKTQFFAVYEHDPTKEYTLTKKTTFGIKGKVNGVDVSNESSVENVTKYKTDHELYGNLDYSRVNFFKINTLPVLGGQTRGGFRVFGQDKGKITFTLPRQELIIK